MNRIRRTLEERGGRKLLVPFLTVGYPDRETSVALAKAAFESGADFLELGMPFSDPLADGPDIQMSSQMALDSGITMKDVLHVAESIRTSCDTPLILMGYFNPVLVYGTAGFIRDAAGAGVDGFIIPDLPIEEAGEFIHHLHTENLSSVFLVAPTTSSARVKLIEAACSHFVYAVTVAGVTGTGKRFDRSTDQYLSRLRRTLNKPFVAGFGVSSAESALRLTKHADGVVIGSALIRAFREARSKQAGIREVTRLLTDIRKAI